MKTLFRPALTLFVLLSAVTGIVYPVAVTGIAKVLFPELYRPEILLGPPLGHRSDAL